MAWIPESWINEIPEIDGKNKDACYGADY